jgi:hypothetical protein
MKVTISWNEQSNMWLVSTYKSTIHAKEIIVGGSWITEIRSKSIRWVAHDHTKVEILDGKNLDYPKIERIDTHKDTDLLNWEIVGTPILFTLNGVYTTNSGGMKTMASIEEELKAKGVALEKVKEQAVETEHSPTPHSKVTDFITKSMKHMQTLEQKTTQTLEEYYYEKYGTPKSDLEAVRLLSTAYEELIGGITPEISEGIAEYYRIIAHRGFPPFHWIIESFHVVSKKEPSKRNFKYVVGMLRSWMRNGFGHIPTQEEDDVVSFMQEIIGCELTYEARQVIQSLLGTYGATKIAYMIHELKNVDYSYYMALSLKDILIEKFGEKPEAFAKAE